ncbi:MAG: hypothetical protein ABEJ81_01520 [Haloferacaceae archaeon]
MTDVRRRRLLSSLGAGATAVLAGCSGLFVRPDSGTETGSTPTETPTATGTPTPTPTPSSVHDAAVVSVPSFDLSLRYLPVSDVTTADVSLRVRNVSGRVIRRLDLRVDLVYRPRTVDRTVAVDYVGRHFGDGLDDGAETTLDYGTRYPNDGRADGSSDPADFDLVFRIRGVEFV